MDSGSDGHHSDIEHSSRSNNIPDVCIVSATTTSAAAAAPSSPRFADHNRNHLESQPLLGRMNSQDLDQNSLSHHIPWNTIEDDPEYAETVHQAERAIEGGILPVRIAAGSSGSYFVRNLEGKTVSVFKPKDEEPYGMNNPKWSKWVQKTLCPCCFGRGCLIPNQGYLSEAGASLIDIKLKLNIVPKTRVVRLAADSFNYPAFQRRLIIAKREINESVGRQFQGRRVFQPKGLPAKVGSFQIFVENYQDADVFLKQLEHDQPVSEEIASAFQSEFERLVVLDYIIRNTDRNNSNWLVKWGREATGSGGSGPNSINERDKLLHSLSSPRLQETTTATATNSPTQNVENDGVHLPAQTTTLSNGAGDAPYLSSGQSQTTSGGYQQEQQPQQQPPMEVKIAAIDNGLAFPFKHPDEWRTYPFHWAWLPQAKIPFSDKIKDLVLPFLSDMNFVQRELCDEIQRLFAQDKNYDRRLCERQLSVMRGQILNLAQAMRDGKSPFQLVQMPGVVVERLGGHAPKQFRQKFNDRYPLFSWF